MTYPTTLSPPGEGREHGFCQVGTRQGRWAMANIKAKVGNNAVVLGASMAGLLAARSLADFFDTVTVVERDPLPDAGAARRGVPQGRHLHALLARGAQVLEELFPGILDELVLDGAHYLDGRDLSRVYYDV